MQKYGFLNDPVKQYYKTINEASSFGFYMMLTIPTYVICKQYGKLNAKEGREARFVQMCLDVYSDFQNGKITLDELNKVLWDEAGVKIV